MARYTLSEIKKISCLNSSRFYKLKIFFNRKFKLSSFMSVLFYKVLWKNFCHYNRRSFEKLTQRLDGRDANFVSYMIYIKTPLSGLSRTRSKKYVCFCLFWFWLKDCFLNLISWIFRYKSRCAQNLFVSSRLLHS